MSFSQDTIDRIVANVLNQLGGTPVAAVPPVAPRPAVQPVPAATTPTPRQVQIQQSVITAALLEPLRQGETVQVLPRAIITPAAQDIVRGRQLNIVRDERSNDTVKGTSAVSAVSTGPRLLIVVKNSQALDQLWSELTGNWRRELTGCPDDAARLAIAEIARGGAEQIVIVAEQTHRAACLANRHERVKAVAIRDAGDVRLIRKQLRANTWCLDGAGKTYFEFKNLFREIQSK